MTDLIQQHTRGDRKIWVIVILLSLFSILIVYSSTRSLAYKYQGGNTEFYIIKHIMLGLFGLVLMYVAHLIDYRYYSRIAQIILFISIPLLLYTLIFGRDVNDASRWITLPVINLSFQTSDLAKMALIMYTARTLSRKQENIKDFKSAFLPILLPVLIVCGLIAPANLSTAMLLFVTCLLLMFIGRINMKYIFLMVSMGILLLAVVIGLGQIFPDLVRDETWIARIKSFLSGTDSYQIVQSKIAIAKGSILSIAPGTSTQSNFLPHPYSDFIFSVFIEEYGLMGGFILIALYIGLLYRAIKIVLKAPHAFGALLAFGLSLSLVIQAFIHMGVAVDLFPATGQPLPLMSMGGTSLWFTGISIGIILSVSRSIEDQKAEPAQTEGELNVAET